MLLITGSLYTVVIYYTCRQSLEDVILAIPDTIADSLKHKSAKHNDRKSACFKKEGMFQEQQPHKTSQ